MFSSRWRIKLTWHRNTREFLESRCTKNAYLKKAGDLEPFKYLKGDEDAQVLWE